MGIGEREASFFLKARERHVPVDETTQQREGGLDLVDVSLRFGAHIFFLKRLSPRESGSPDVIRSPYPRLRADTTMLCPA